MLHARPLTVPEVYRQAVTVPSLSLLPFENRQPVAVQTGVNAALGGAFVLGAPAPNWAVAGFEQIVVAASSMGPGAA